MTSTLGRVRVDVRRMCRGREREPGSWWVASHLALPSCADLRVRAGAPWSGIAWSACGRLVTQWRWHGPPSCPACFRKWLDSWQDGSLDNWHERPVT